MVGENFTSLSTYSFHFHLFCFLKTESGVQLWNKRHHVWRTRGKLWVFWGCEAACQGWCSAQDKSGATCHLKSPCVISDSAAAPVCHSRIKVAFIWAVNGREGWVILKVNALIPTGLNGHHVVLQQPQDVFTNEPVKTCMENIHIPDELSAQHTHMEIKEMPHADRRVESGPDSNCHLPATLLHRSISLPTSDSKQWI